MTTCTSCKTLYNVLSQTHITIGGLRRFTFLSRGMVYVEGGGLYWRGKFMLEEEESFMLVRERFMLEGRIHLGTAKRESPDFGSSGCISGYVNSNQF